MSVFHPVAAVVVAHNSSRTLPRCIRSLWANDVVDIIVVDNESSDDSLAVARQLGVSAVSSVGNVGFAAGCNYGAKFFEGHYNLLFLNPDAWLQPNAVHKAMQQFAHSDVGVVGMQLRSVDNHIDVYSAGQEPSLLHLVRRTVMPGRRRATRTDWVSGGAMIVRHDVWVEVDGFDEGFFLYWEDVDLCYRVREKGKRIVIARNAAAIHERGASFAATTNKTAMYDKSADRYYRLHYATPLWLLHRFLRQIFRWYSPQVH